MIADAALDKLRNELEAGLRKAQPTVEEYRAQVVAWLRRREEKWRETAQALPGAVGDTASFYAAAYHNAAQGIEAGEPERRAAMEKADAR